MDLLKDALSGNLVAVAVAGAAAVAVPVLASAVVPNLAAPLRGAFKLGISLFLESESELDAKFIAELVQNTLAGILSALSGPGSEEERRKAAAARVGHFERRVRARAARFAWNEQDRAERYRRHVGTLKQAIAGAKRRRPKNARPALDHISEIVGEDW
jgi:hypothetical protein